ncbi:hypothetical protein HYFRA_00008460 [Hymenoscyphus fraxineus]|uniref:ADF-H domain-containing protein n=1 Tax=Hymenoscyphus fraxineus TaxID=746836 RepID=A0A9N9KQK1_9HELO|nr:hypothetical protein HYFRA_00008460 [Hymenoscyphus fraxineus]
MSLNGLDDAKLKEAYDASVAEPGGWFLLKYAARDEVDLLGRGNGGIVEIRNAIAAYEEPSPLFGYLRYRRRNVLIKYVPEDCSRLVQARVAVHFNAVTERFSPHDTIFSITTSKELRDTTLSQACSLHTASGSTSSSTSSLRRRRLMEIAEDEEEDNRKRQSTVLEERPGTEKPTPPSSDVQTDPVLIPLPTSESTDTFAPPPPRATPSFDTSPPPPREPLNLETSPPPPREPLKIDDSYSLTQLENARQSSQSTRPESYKSSYFGGRPKVKLGPRPSLDANKGRPHTSGSGASHYRPVSTLPQGVKIFSKALRRGIGRPKSTHNTEEPAASALALPQTAHTTFIRPHTSGGRPPPSPGSALSPPVISPKTPKTPTITPEKARLLKALELRKKQMNMPPPVPESIEPSSTSPDDSKQTIEVPPVNSPTEIKETSPVLDDLAKADDSAIAFDSNAAPKTDESDATKSDSYPVSPVGPSEPEESTRASSITESTAGNVQDMAEPKLPSEAVDSGTNGIASAKEEETKTAISESDDPAVSSASQDKPAVNGSPNQAVVEAVAKDHVSNPMTDDGEATTQAAVKSPLPDETTDTDISVITKVKKHVAFGEPLDTEEFEPVDHESSPIDRPVSAENPPIEEPVAKEDSPAAPLAQSSPPEEASVGIEPSITESSASPPEAEVEQPTIEVSEPKSHVQDSNVESSSSSAEAQALPSLEPQKPSVDDTDNKPPTSLQEKRGTLVEPIRTDIELTDKSNSDANLSSDEDFMNELQSAVVQEAKPISVSKSPVSPMFPASRPADSWRNSRTPSSRAASNPVQKGETHLAPPTINEPVVQPPARSSSAGAAYLNRINQENSKPVAKKVNLGSTISQRIKALEKLSSLAPGAAAPPAPGPSAAVTPAFFSVKRASIKRTSRSPSIVERTNSLSHNGPASPTLTRESSPETLRNRSNSVRNRLSSFEPATVPMAGPTRARPESISVTARIVRDPSQPLYPLSDIGKDPSEYAPLDLQESPLVISHQRAIASEAKETLQERRLSKEQKRLSSSSSATNTTADHRSSVTIMRDSVSDSRNSFADRAERRRSMNLESSSYLQNSSRPQSVITPSRPLSAHISSPMIYHYNMSQSSTGRNSTSSNRDMPISSPSSDNQSINEEKGGKKPSRTTRMLRRMSSSLSSSRKALAAAVSPTVREDPEPAFFGKDQPKSPSTPGVNIGDVNVQFPDSLLWKRRSVLLDSNGFLVLSPALTASGSGKSKAVGATRKFHLSEFRRPVIPDIEMQELPNSVLLDFIEGSGLQIACEDRAGQGQILEVLQSAHQSYAGSKP